MTDSEAGTNENNSRRWVDPYPDVQGVLLSDMIKLYVDEIGLIDPFEPSSLKPASYGARLGFKYYINGQFGNLMPDETLKIPPNSVAYVSFLERINMPYYMIGRFNLKIDLIYQGLILGTGPQVDPGFRGLLSCPLHNISSNEIGIEQGERFATIDFEKTTPFAAGEDPEHLRTLGFESRLYEQQCPEYDSACIRGRAAAPCLLFPVTKIEKSDLNGYIPSGRLIKSSVQGVADSAEASAAQVAGIAAESKRFSQAMESRAETMEARFLRRRKFEWLALAAVLVAVFGLGFTFIQYLESRDARVDARLFNMEQKLELLRAAPQSDANAAGRSSAPTSPAPSDPETPTAQTTNK